MKLLYYLPAIGEGNMEIKRKILFHNLKYIYDNINEPFDVCINFYTICEITKMKLSSLHFINNLYIYEEKGKVLTELFLVNPNNKYVSSYDYILFIMDDVVLLDVDIKKMIEIKEKYKIEMLSTKILKSTHQFMNCYSGLTINNFLEVYLLLLTPTDFYTFCSIHTIENKWMWGVDLLFGYYKIRAGVINTYVAQHAIPSKSDKREAEECMCNYLIKHTKYRNTSDICKDFSDIIENIAIEN